MIFKNLIPKQYWIGVLLGAVLIVASLIIEPRIVPPSGWVAVWFDPLLPGLLGGAVTGFIVRKGVIGGVVAGFLAGLIGGTVFLVRGLILTPRAILYLLTLLILVGALDVVLYVVIPAAIGGVIGGGARMIFIAFQCKTSKA